MRRTCKPLFWRATRSVNTADCKNEWKYFLKCNINISITIRFKQYLLSIIQSVEFTGRVACQNNGLYVLRMIVKLAYRYYVGRFKMAVAVAGKEVAVSERMLSSPFYEEDDCSQLFFTNHNSFHFHKLVLQVDIQFNSTRFNFLFALFILLIN